MIHESKRAHLNEVNDQSQDPQVGETRVRTKTSSRTTFLISSKLTEDILCFEKFKFKYFVRSATQDSRLDQTEFVEKHA